MVTERLRGAALALIVTSCGTTPAPPSTSSTVEAPATTRAHRIAPTVRRSSAPAPPKARPAANLRPRVMRHPESVSSLAFSPDGRLLASAGKGQAILLWDLSTRRQVRTLEGHKGDVNAVCFSPAGAAGAAPLFSGGQDGTVRAWNVKTGRQLWITTPRPGANTKGAVAKPAEISDLSCAPTGGSLASVHADGTIQIWSSSGELRRTLRPGRWRTIAFSPDGKQLAATRKNQVALLRARDGRILRRWPVRRFGRSASVAFAPDGKTIAIGGGGRRGRKAQLITISAGGRRDLPHEATVMDLAFSPKKKILVTAAEVDLRAWGLTGAKPRIFDLPGDPKTIFDGPQPGLWVLAISPDGETVATAAVGGMITTFPLQRSSGGLRKVAGSCPASGQL